MLKRKPKSDLLVHLARPSHVPTWLMTVLVVSSEADSCEFTRLSVIWNVTSEICLHEPGIAIPVNLLCRIYLRELINLSQVRNEAAGEEMFNQKATWNVFGENIPEETFEVARTSLLSTLSQQSARLQRTSKRFSKIKFNKMIPFQSVPGAWKVLDLAGV